MRALVSVFDKTNIVDLCKKFHELNIEIISTGGTSKVLAENNIPFTEVSKITNNKEAFGGRMKTISFEMSSSILFRRDHPTDIKEAESLKINGIDIVVCNLYDFNQAVKNKANIDELIELIDVGGPTMIRAAAKNYKFVSVLTDPRDYDSFTLQLLKNKTVSLATNQQLSLKAFKLLSGYDLSVSLELEKRFNNKIALSLSAEERPLRYGENPHQPAKISILNNSLSEKTLANAPVIQGKEISYNNYLDADAAYKCVSELGHMFPTFFSTVIVKHGTPCGVSTSDTLINSLLAAWEADNVSAFGGIISFSSEVNEEIAHFFDDKFVELIIAPKFSPSALEILSAKKNVRLIELPIKPIKSDEQVMKSINGGVLIQTEDELLASELSFNNVTENDFAEIPHDLILFGQTIIKYKKSNCLALVSKEGKTFKITASGVGQPNRLECLSLLIKNKIIEKNISKDILFSDAFFPFADSIIAAHELGIKYIVQPGGSIKDKEVIKKCNELNIAMKFSASRHFRH